MPGMVGSVMTFGVDGLLLFAGVALFVEALLLVVALLFVGVVDFFVVVAGLLVVFLLDFCCADHAQDSTVMSQQRTKPFAIKRHVTFLMMLYLPVVALRTGFFFSFSLAKAYEETIN
jgi:hypothetical protein